jgi:glycosyltransferase involved in cell wall biosynthesis
MAPPPARPPHFEGRPNVVFVGRLQRRKRVDQLLYACAALPERIQPRLTIVGDGPDRESLSALAAEVYPETEFPGAQHGPDLTPFLHRADLFVLPGTGGLAIQEAMAHGLAVIVAEGDGTQEDLVRSGNGWLVPTDDLDALTRSLLEALSNPVRLRRMGAESFRVVQEEINVQAMVEVFVNVLNTLEGSNGGVEGRASAK